MQLSAPAAAQPACELCGSSRAKRTIVVCYRKAGLPTGELHVRGCALRKENGAVRVCWFIATTIF